MGYVFAATVTIDDLKNYFKGESWRLSGLTDGHIEAHSDNYDVSITSKSFVYHVKIEAVDDPTDSDEKITDDPLEAITRFLGEAGGDDLLKHVSTPASVSHALRIVAAQIELKEIPPRRAAWVIRRMISRCASRDKLEKDELVDLMGGLKHRGWKVEESILSNGLPSLIVDISGIYTVQISIDSIAWDYNFAVHGIPESERSGITDDPIAQYRSFYKDPDIREAKRKRIELNSLKKKQVLDDATVPPKRNVRKFDTY